MTQDMRGVIEPKSDQINADDFMSGPQTFRIKGVAITPGSEQPVTIALEGSKPFRPCKSMSRLLVAAWGADAKEYTGRSFTLYRDPKVKWGGLEVGGIRISHLSHIEREMVVALTMTKGKRAPHTVKPLKAPVAELKAVENKSEFDFDAFEAEVMALIQTAEDAEPLKASWAAMEPTRRIAGAQDKNRAISLATKIKEKLADLAQSEGAPF